MDTPVLLLVFNRPEFTRRMMAAVREYRPRVLYVAADGPRDTEPADAERCRLARAVATQVDWPCELRTLFRERNLGCRDGVADGIDWFFEQEPAGIVLEDDCVPAPTFFRFCGELLERYRDDARVMQVCGTNILAASNLVADSYAFTRFGPVWGWASWRRAWRQYDRAMAWWPEARQRRALAEVIDDTAEVAAREALYDRLHRGEIDTWDYQWGAIKLVAHGLSIVPRVNLISNIGFGPDATHTRGPDPRADLPTGTLTFPLVHPATVATSAVCDAAYIAAAGLRGTRAPPPRRAGWRRWLRWGASRA
jgi:hypothetical protein